MTANDQAAIAKMVDPLFHAIAEIRPTGGSLSILVFPIGTSGPNGEKGLVMFSDPTAEHVESGLEVLSRIRR